jgi:hypothetical protein
MVGLIACLSPRASLVVVVAGEPVHSKEDARVKRLLCLAALGALCSSCGPIDYLNTVARKATRAVAEAQTADAEHLSPYEYWSAMEYIHMAREKAAYADYEIAISYGEKAEQMAKEARRIAAEKAQAGPARATTGEEVPPDLSPKKGGGK